ncbi:MAG: hypothetical protein MHM6MM_001251 [Cercozoa sp. M6MM]
MSCTGVSVHAVVPEKRWGEMDCCLERDPSICGLRNVTRSSPTARTPRWHMDLDHCLDGQEQLRRMIYEDEFEQLLLQEVAALDPELKEATERAISTSHDQLAILTVAAQAKLLTHVQLFRNRFTGAVASVSAQCSAVLALHDSLVTQVDNIDDLADLCSSSGASIECGHHDATDWAELFCDWTSSVSEDARPLVEWRFALSLVQRSLVSLTQCRNITSDLRLLCDTILAGAAAETELSKFKDVLFELQNASFRRRVRSLLRFPQRAHSLIATSTCVAALCGVIPRLVTSARHDQRTAQSEDIDLLTRIVELADVPALDEHEEAMSQARAHYTLPVWMQKRGLEAQFAAVENVLLGHVALPLAACLMSMSHGVESCGTPLLSSMSLDWTLPSTGRLIACMAKAARVALPNPVYSCLVAAWARGVAGVEAEPAHLHYRTAWNGALLLSCTGTGVHDNERKVEAPFDVMHVSPRSGHAGGHHVSFPMLSPSVIRTVINVKSPLWQRVMHYLSRSELLAHGEACGGASLLCARLQLVSRLLVPPGLSLREALLQTAMSCFHTPLLGTRRDYDESEVTLAECFGCVPILCGQQRRMTPWHYVWLSNAVATACLRTHDAASDVKHLHRRLRHALRAFYHQVRPRVWSLHRTCMLTDRHWTACTGDTVTATTCPRRSWKVAALCCARYCSPCRCCRCRRRLRHGTATSWTPSLRPATYTPSRRCCCDASRSTCCPRWRRPSCSTWPPCCRPAGSTCRPATTSHRVSPCTSDGCRPSRRYCTSASVSATPLVFCAAASPV